jgi:hypothetical protein
MQRAAMAILVAAIFAASTNISHSKPTVARKPAIAELELLFGAIRPESLEQKMSEMELRYTRFASMEDICVTLETAAADHELPVSFFARLIWQESRFRPYAVSPVGARGIAQFMPATARERGLDDPFDPIAALHKSAGFLRDLRNQFGNLGLAAAAYNGGPGRVQAWLKGRGGLPTETRQYVHIVTGSPADRWRGKEVTAVQTGRIPEKVPCPALVAMAAANADIEEPVRQAAAEVRRAGGDKSSNSLRASNVSEKKTEKRSVKVARKTRVVKSRAAGRGKARTSRVRVAETDRGRKL